MSDINEETAQPEAKPKPYIHGHLEIRLYAGRKLVMSYVDPMLWADIMGAIQKRLERDADEQKQVAP